MEGYCKRISQHVWGVLIVYGPHWVCPSSWQYVLSRSTLLRLQGALQGNCPKQTLNFIHFPGLSHSGSGSWVQSLGTDSVGRALCARPRSEQLRWPGAWWAQCPRWIAPVNHCPVPDTQFPGCAPCLLWGADLRLLLSWQISTVQDPRKTWLATGSLLTVRWRTPVSGAETVPCLLALVVARLPLCL